MLYLDTCVLLALLTPEIHASAAVTFLQATDAPPGDQPLECCRALNATLCSLDAPFVSAAQQLGLDAILIAAPDGSRP
jgi:hypothetical protein